MGVALGASPVVAGLVGEDCFGLNEAVAGAAWMDGDAPRLGSDGALDRQRAEHLEVTLGVDVCAVLREGQNTC